jgi:H+-transporting ATPase
MNSYAIYRIAETLRVLLFMTLAILVFNFYPLTAVMIVMLALLNDGAILSIAYDNVRYRNQPEAWNMRVVLGVSTVLGVIGTVAAFGLFYLGLNIFHLDHAHVQTLMYLKLSVAGHLTIFLTRTRGPFWSIRPAKILWIAVLGTQAIATLIAVYGVFMAPLGWRYAGIVWGYALVWFLLNDRIKLLTYWVLDRSKSQAKTNVKAVDGKADVNTAAKAQPALDAKTHAESLTGSKLASEAQANPGPSPKAEPPLQPQAATASEENEPIGPGTKSAAAQPVVTEPAPGASAGHPAKIISSSASGRQTDANCAGQEAKAEAGSPAKAPLDLTPKLVERVHALYEELGRQDVMAVQELERAQKELKETSHD